MSADTLSLPTYPVGPAERPKGIDLRAVRPFEQWPVPALNAAVGGWLCGSPPSLELATLALLEIERRGNDGLRARLKFARYGLEPIQWLPDAVQAVKSNLRRDPDGAGGAHVYVILRGGYTRSNGFYGAYVGCTTRSVRARFTEHRTHPKRAARGLIRHGIEPLWSLFDHLNPVPRAARTEWETRLHEALAPVVPKVTGDVAF